MKRAKYRKKSAAILIYTMFPIMGHDDEDIRIGKIDDCKFCFHHYNYYLVLGFTIVDNHCSRCILVLVVHLLVRVRGFAQGTTRLIGVKLTSTRNFD